MSSTEEEDKTAWLDAQTDHAYRTFLEIYIDVRERLGVFACVMQLDVDDDLLRCISAAYTNFMRAHPIYMNYRCSSWLFYYPDMGALHKALDDGFSAWNVL